ncbi:hypothetical protein [Flavobacterium sp. LB1P71]|uniref:hypothetical protein n=1 Tax=unclassified Flavobacterium TaxID=196869 RepID=UPI003AAEB7A8
MIEVGVVLLNHKGSHYLEDLYLNISEKIGMEFGKWLFLIVDNSLDEKESIFIRNFACKRSNIEIIFSEENKGYAHGNNLGLRYLSENGIKYGMIVNPDIIFLTQDFISHFINLIKTNKAISIIGPKLLDPIGNEITIITKMNFINAVIDYNPSFVESKPKDVYATMGCCLFLDVFRLKEINFLDEGTFLYREEQILAEKLIVNKMLWYILPVVEVVHNHSRKLQSPSKLLRHKLYEYESTKLYFVKYLNYSGLYVFAYLILFLFKTFLYYNYVIIIYSINAIKKKYLDHRSIQ